MRDDLKENIKLTGQRLVPFVLSLLFILFNYIPSNLGFSNIIRPEVGVICVFYWVLNRPDLFNMFMVFFLGLVSDMMSAIPLGTNTVCYLIIYLILNNMSSFFCNKPFNVVWLMFSFVFVLVEFFKWLEVSIYYAEFSPIGHLFFTILFTIACYPLISFINDAARRYLMNDDEE